MLSSRWPFDVRVAPFYYGWVIFLLSALGIVMSVPGQTMGMAVFTEHFMAAADLSRTALSMAYLVGTVGSALLLTSAGRLYDRIGARLMVAGSALGLGLMVASLAFFDQIATRVAAWVGIPAPGLAFLLVLGGYFGVRLFGQGVLTQASRNVLLVWFERRRGLVSGVRGVVVSLAFSLAPPVLAWLILAFHWRGALLLMALVVGGGFALLALLLLRDSPASCGVPVDGGGDGTKAKSAVAESLPLRVARRSPVFWIYALALAMHALFGTALTFHVVDIFGDAERSAAEAFAYFLPSAVVSTTVNLGASALVDRYPMKPFLVVMLILFCVGAVGLANLATEWGFWLLVIGFGGGGGLWGVISSLAWVRLYGPLYLGEVSGFAQALSVFGSAVGPALFSVGRNFGDGYGAPVLVCTGALAVLLIVALVLPQRELAPAVVQ